MKPDGLRESLSEILPKELAAIMYYLLDSEYGQYDDDVQYILKLFFHDDWDIFIDPDIYDVPAPIIEQLVASGWIKPVTRDSLPSEKPRNTPLRPDKVQIPTVRLNHNICSATKAYGGDILLQTTQA